MDAYIDYWNLMAYDYAGSWDTVAGHQANLHASSRLPNATQFSTDAALAHYTSVTHGRVAPGKIVLGMPLYGRSFFNTAGPGTPFSGVGSGSWEAGVWDYKALPLHLSGSNQTRSMQIHLDREIGASYMYDASARVMVSYDTPEMASIKAQYIKSRGLAGAMWWESSADAPINEERSLVRTVRVNFIFFLPPPLKPAVPIRPFLFQVSMPCLSFLRPHIHLISIFTFYLSLASSYRFFRHFFWRCIHGSLQNQI